MSFRDLILKKYKISAGDDIILFHGGAPENLRALKKDFKILTPAEKLKVPSTGGGKIGLSTSTNQYVAQQYSKAFRHNTVLPLVLSKDAKIYSISTKGRGIDEVLSDEEILGLQAKGYDAIFDSGSGEEEYRILNSKHVKVR